jgi:hypothetical protein
MKVKAIPWIFNGFPEIIYTHTGVFLTSMRTGLRPEPAPKILLFCKKAGEINSETRFCGTIYFSIIKRDTGGEIFFQ